MQSISMVDPNYMAEKMREEALPTRTWTDLPSAHSTPHMYRAMLPVDLAPGSHKIEVRSVDENGREVLGRRIIRVVAQTTEIKRN